MRQPRQSHFMDFQSTSFQTKGKCRILAEISQIKIRDVVSSGGRKNVRATTSVREKPKPQTPRRIPPKITASPIKIYKKGVNSCIKLPDTIFFCNFLSNKIKNPCPSFHFFRLNSLDFLKFPIYIYIFKLFPKKYFLWKRGKK